MCLLFAFLDPAHEQRVAEILREALPDAFVVASHEVAAEVREFERATTATVDAALGPPTGRYLSRLRAATEEAGLPAPHVMLSSGGVATLEQAAAHPAAMLLSGPAGGAVAARIVSEPPALGFDMGGTSCDTFLLAEGGGESELTVDRRVAGLPVRLPMVDIHTVSAGGGSIAWVDSGGALRVGPQSAGADPGPACYGRGGTEPTVTDANLVLGRLPADSPIASDLKLDMAAARDSAGDASGRQRRGGGRGRRGRGGQRDGAGAARRLGRARPRPGGRRADRVRRRGPAARVRAGDGARRHHGPVPPGQRRAVRRRARRCRAPPRQLPQPAAPARRRRRPQAHGRAARRRPQRARTCAPPPTCATPGSRSSC